MKKYLLVILIVLIKTQSAFAYKYHGKFTFGSFFSDEQLNKSIAGSKTNDEMLFSNKLYLEFSEITEQNLETLIDIKNKYDFFDKVDRNTLKLTPTNQLLLRQLALKKTNPFQGVHFSLGRFQTSEKGINILDGIDVGYRLNSNIDGGLIYGLNPEINGTYNLDFRKNSILRGTYLTYKRQDKKNERFFLFSNAYNENLEQSKIDRQFLHNTTIFQLNNNHRIYLMNTLDLLPEVHIQNSWITANNKMGEDFSLNSTFFIINAIEYERTEEDDQQEATTGSYTSAKLILNQKTAEKSKMAYKVAIVQRTIDDLQKKSLGISYLDNSIFSKNLSFKIDLDYALNFNSNDFKTILNFAYYTQKIELSMLETVILKKYPQRSNAIINSEGNFSYIFAKNLFTGLTLQYFTDNLSDIFSFFFRLSYRFGTKEIPSPRDGAPPIGVL